MAFREVKLTYGVPGDVCDRTSVEGKGALPVGHGGHTSDSQQAWPEVGAPSKNLTSIGPYMRRGSAEAQLFFKYDIY